VRSYRTFSPLPVPCETGGIFSVALSVHPGLPGLPGRYPAHCPSEFGLSSPAIARNPVETGVQDL